MNQADLKREYEQQQTPAGQAALKVKREMLEKFRAITGTTLLNVGKVEALHDARTGEITQYYKCL